MNPKTKKINTLLQCIDSAGFYSYIILYSFKKKIFSIPYTDL